MDLAMFTSGSWLYFTLIPTWALQRMHPSCWNFERRRDVLASWKMLRAFAFTLSIQPAVPLTQRSHTGWPKRSWVVWPCLTAQHMRISWIIIGKISRGSLTFSRVCFTFGGHAEATCEHAGRTNWFHEFPISQDLTMHFCINFTIFKMMQTVLWKWAKTPLHSSLDPGNGRWVAMFECQRTDLVLWWKVMKKMFVNRNQASGTMRPTSVASILIEFWQWKIDTLGCADVLTTVSSSAVENLDSSQLHCKNMVLYSITDIALDFFFLFPRWDMWVPYSFFFHVPFSAYNPQKCFTTGPLGTLYFCLLVPGRSCNSSGDGRNRFLGATAGWSQSGPPKNGRKIQVKDLDL